jgi:hypothetical protein
MPIYKLRATRIVEEEIIFDGIEAVDEERARVQAVGNVALLTVNGKARKGKRKVLSGYRVYSVVEIKPKEQKSMKRTR